MVCRIHPAIIGVFQQFNKYFVAYDTVKIIGILVKSGMTHEEAQEHFEYNMVGGYIGEATPACTVIDSEGTSMLT